jgi:hypothetical protein
MKMGVCVARWAPVVVALAGIGTGALGADPWADEVVSFGAGVDGLPGYDQAQTALGSPERFTGEGVYPGAVTPFNPAWGADEIVSVGIGGWLTVRFDSPVRDRAQNPFGIDLLVFGNASLSSSDFWVNRDPSAITLGADLFDEPSRVSVSQDGVIWHPFNSGPFADSFAPTLGRVYDPVNPDKSIGDFNLWWGKETDATLPLDPALGPADFDGKTVAEAAGMYGRSAGGAGFDIGALGLDWIEYVRIENPGDSGVTPEVDAIADVAAVPEPGMAGAAVLGAALLIGRRRKP